MPKGIAMSPFLFMKSISLDCMPTPGPPAIHPNPASIIYGMFFTNFLCGWSQEISVSVNFSSIDEIAFDRSQVQVIIGYSSDTSTIIRRTELPVILRPGMDLLGFAHHRKLRQFRNPRFSAFGLFAVCTRIICLRSTILTFKAHLGF